MAEFSVKDIQNLREKTGAGMMDCKKALAEAEGDMEKAVDILRKKGAATAAKRADRDAKEGLIVSKVSADKKSAVLVEVNCETDFVSRNEQFGSFGDKVVSVALDTRPASLEALLSAQSASIGNQTVSEFATEMTGKTGEKVEVRRVAFVTVSNGLIVDYIHPGSKLGVLVALETPGADNEKVATLGRDIAMQMAAANPLVLTRDKMDNTKIEAELSIYRTMALNEGKPEKIIDNIAKGKLEKFYKDFVLIEQEFVRDPAKTIKMVIDETAKELGIAIQVVHFERFLLGENK